MISSLLTEIERCENLLKRYQEIPTGKFAVIMIKKDIQDAKEAISNNNFLQIIVSLKRLKKLE